MLNREMMAEFADCLPDSKVAIVNPGTDGADAERYGIGKVSWLLNSTPSDTVIESTTDDDESAFMEVAELLRGLAMIDSAGKVQIFIPGWEGQNYAYFEVAEVHRSPYLHSIVLGAWIYGA